MSNKFKTRVKIKRTDFYTYPKSFPCLAPESEGIIIGTINTTNFLRGYEIQYLVKLSCGTFPFYREELIFPSGTDALKEAAKHKTGATKAKLRKFL